MWHCVYLVMNVIGAMLCFIAAPLFPLPSAKTLSSSANKSPGSRFVPPGDERQLKIARTGRVSGRWAQRETSSLSRHGWLDGAGLLQRSCQSAAREIDEKLDNAGEKPGYYCHRYPQPPSGAGVRGWELDRLVLESADLSSSSSQFSSLLHRTQLYKNI